MNYDAKTDRELDALVAEKVMGVDACLIHEPKSFLHPDYCFGCKKSFPHRYSTVVTYAFSVVEAMRERGFIVRITDEVRGGWCVKFNGYHDISESLPRSICLAALRALEE